MLTFLNCLQRSHKTNFFLGQLTESAAIFDAAGEGHFTGRILCLLKLLWLSNTMNFFKNVIVNTVFDAGRDFDILKLMEKITWVEELWLVEAVLFLIFTREPYTLSSTLAVILKQLKAIQQKTFSMLK